MSAEQTTITYRDVPGHPGYRVGSDGSVWSCRKRIPWGNGVRGTKAVIGDEWKRLKATMHHKTRYWYVILADRKTYLVHRLVLLAFVGPCPPGMECRHFPDNNRGNNAIANLRWGTKKENQADRIESGTDGRGERNFCSKLTDDTVRQARKEHATGVMGTTLLARKYGVSNTAMKLMIARKTWKHVV